MDAAGAETDVALSKSRLEIAESLRRSSAMNIDPHRTAPYIGDTAGGERVRRAASPVIDELCGLMLGVSTGVVLTDEEAQVLDMRTGDPDLSAYFEENGGLIGSGWSEELMGTSAIALAVKLGKPMLVSGDEHYVAGLKDCTAAAAPIFDPFHRKLVGALILSGRERASSPHMLPAVVQAAKAVEQRLYEDASPTEHPLLERFLAAVARTPNEAVFALNERMVLSNQAATELLRAVERSTLWHQALDTVAGIRGTEATNLLTLRDGRSLDAAFEKADSESARAGILVRVAPNEGEADASGSRATTMAPRAPSQSPDCYLEQRIAGSVWLASGLLITGEPGSGKLTTAEEIHRRSGREKLAILDGATDPGNGGPGILRDLSASASDPGITVIVRHAECLSQRALTTIRSVLSDHGARLIATMTVAADAEEPSDLRDLFPHQVQVPPLRDRLEDLAAIVGELMQRHGATGRMQPAAVQALARHEWPGNIRELDAVIRTVVASRRTCDISPRDLPPSYTATCAPRRLTRMEYVERSAIQHALMEAEGNRTRAAAILQIGRATLYRKIKSYGLEIGTGAMA